MLADMYDIEGRAILYATLKTITSTYNVAKKTDPNGAYADFLVAHDAAFEIFLKGKGPPMPGITNSAYHIFMSSRG